MKELMVFGLIERRIVDGVYHIFLTEKGKKVKELLEEISRLLE